MNIQDSLSVIKVFLVVCAVISIVVGIVRLAGASKKGHGKWYKIKAGITSVFAATVFLIFASLLSGEMDNSGEMIKAQYPMGISDITYGQAIDKVCGNQKWSRMTSQYTTSGSAIVQMDADCIYAGGNHRITIQFNYGMEDFELIDANTPFKITFVGLDGAEETPVQEMQDIIYEMFAHYADGKGMTLDESVKDYILYSEGWGGGTASAEIGSEEAVDEPDIIYHADSNNDMADIPWQSEFPTEDIPMTIDSDEITYPLEGWDSSIMEGEPEGGEYFIGDWSDMNSEWLYMKITCDDGVHYHIEMGDRLSSSEFTSWSFTGVYDADLDGLVYTDGKRWDIYQLEKTLIYTDGSGVFQHGDDGTIWWKDDKENYGAYSTFEGADL